MMTSLMYPFNCPRCSEPVSSNRLCMGCFDAIIAETRAKAEAEKKAKEQAKVEPRDNSPIKIEGVDVRDYFAAAALQAYLGGGERPAPAAKQAYVVADAMMAAREKRGGQVDE